MAENMTARQLHEAEKARVAAEKAAEKQKAQASSSSEQKPAPAPKAKRSKK